MSSSKKIAYLVSQYPAANHTYILREIRSLRNLGWNIEVASIRADIRSESQLTLEEREESVHTWYVKSQGIHGAVGAHLATFLTRPRSYMRGMLWSLRLASFDLSKAIWNFLYFTEALIAGQWMRNRGLNHAHVHYSSTVGLMMAKTFPITISITLHGSAEFQNPERFHLREKIEASVFVCAISNYGRDQLMKASGADQWNKFETLPLGIDTEAFAPGPRSSSDRTFNVISVGNLSPEKAQGILIDAVARLIREGRRLRLRLVGDGPDRRALEKHIVDLGLSNIVRMEGTLNQDQLKTLYRESDVFALASLAEGVPVVLMEAMAMEIPCVATRITGIPELIQDGVEGLLVEPSNAGQVSDAIAQLMDNPDLRSRIASAGRYKVIQHYNLAQNTERLARVFDSRIPRI
jgi:colanic acid/amylovoran biosynthesis glycosyltransferase